MRPKEIANMFKHTAKSFTEEELREAAERGDARVMKPKYDNEFTPWSVHELDDIIKKIVEKAKKSNRGKKELKVELKKEEEFDRFATLYPTLFDKMCDKQFVEDERSMGMLRMMLIRRDEVARGVLTQKEANEKVSNDTLMAMASAANEGE